MQREDEKPVYSEEYAYKRIAFYERELPRKILSPRREAQCKERISFFRGVIVALTNDKHDVPGGIEKESSSRVPATVAITALLDHLGLECVVEESRDINWMTQVTSNRKTTHKIVEVTKEST